MVGALWTGISGLSGSQTALDNESNNIANVNTVGYKASRVSFADQMYQDSVGKGVTAADVEKLYTQGSFSTTGVSYDMALASDGFFQVSDGDELYYTRAGNFRMGEGGTLEDVNGYSVQGWAMATLTDDDITSTDNTASYFTDSYSKILGNQIIEDTGSIQTIITKATDYSDLAKSDDEDVYTGAGYKSKATKIADVEALTTAYNKALTQYAEDDPKPVSSPSSTQSDLVNFFGSTGNELGADDVVYIEITMDSSGTKQTFSTSFDTDQATTMKNLVDEISNTSGFNAYITTDDDASNNNYPLDTETEPEKGFIMIEGIVPGEAYTINSVYWTDNSNNNLERNGEGITSLSNATKGTGLGDIESLETALADAVAGKQMDVYDDIPATAVAGSENYTYSISVYDEDTSSYKTISLNTAVSPIQTNNPATGVGTTSSENVTAIVDAINTVADTTNGLAVDTELAYYVEAFNINGNLVIKAAEDHNGEDYSNMEFTGTLNGPSAEVQTFTLTDADATANNTSFTVTINGQTETIDGAANTTKEAQLLAIQTAFANNSDISSIDIDTTTIPGTGVLTVTYNRSAGDIAADPSTSGAGAGATAAADNFAASTEEISQDVDLSGKEGAGAEFLKIVTTISNGENNIKDDIQLRLDSLNLTDSAFGDFEVDESGLITMTQNGVDFAIGQVAVGQFTDNRGLEAVGDNLYKATTQSGSAIFSSDNAGMSEIEGETLELSTSDLSESLVNLMVFQRAFEANAKSITTADGILTTLIALKSR